MANKILDTYLYTGLGFPFELHHVEMISLHGEHIPKIDVRKAADLAIKSLVLQKTRLTGAQIKFIRTYFSKSLREFAEIVNESHMAVKKWEDFKDKSTNMDLNIEILLRLFIYDNITIKSKNTSTKSVKFYKNYIALKNLFAPHASSKTDTSTNLVKRA